MANSGKDKFYLEKSESASEDNVRTTNNVENVPQDVSRQSKPPPIYVNTRMQNKSDYTNKIVCKVNPSVRRKIKLIIPNNNSAAVNNRIPQPSLLTPDFDAISLSKQILITSSSANEQRTATTPLDNTVLTVGSETSVGGLANALHHTTSSSHLSKCVVTYSSTISPANQQDNYLDKLSRDSKCKPGLDDESSVSHSIDVNASSKNPNSSDRYLHEQEQIFVDKVYENNLNHKNSSPVTSNHLCYNNLENKNFNDNAKLVSAVSNISHDTKTNSERLGQEINPNNNSPVLSNYDLSTVFKDKRSNSFTSNESSHISNELRNKSNDIINSASQFSNGQWLPKDIDNECLITVEECNLSKGIIDSIDKQSLDSPAIYRINLTQVSQADSPETKEISEELQFLRSQTSSYEGNSRFVNTVSAIALLCASNIANCNRYML